MAVGSVTIRDASPDDDVAGILTIYNDVIATSTAVYREDPATLDDRMQWFNARQAQAYPVTRRDRRFRHPWLCVVWRLPHVAGLPVQRRAHRTHPRRPAGARCRHDADAGADPARDGAGQARDDWRRGRRQRGVAAVSRAARLRRAPRTCGRWASSSTAGSTSSSCSACWTARERAAPDVVLLKLPERAGAVRHDRSERAVSELAPGQPASREQWMDHFAQLLQQPPLSEAGVREALLGRGLSSREIDDQLEAARRKFAVMTSKPTCGNTPRASATAIPTGRRSCARPMSAGPKDNGSTCCAAPSAAIIRGLWLRRRHPAVSGLPGWSARAAHPS